MDNLTAYIIALVIVIFLLITYCTYVHDKKVRASINNAAAAIGGRSNPYEVVKQINSIHAPTIDDRFMRAELIRYNILDNVAPTASNDVATTILSDAVIDEYMNILNMMFNGHDATAHVVERIGDGWAGAEIRAAATTANDRQTEIKAKKVVAESTSRADAAKKYVESAIANTNDPQSVHDSKVNDDLRDIIKKIKCDDINISAVFASAYEYVGKKPNSLAMRTLRIMSNGAYNSTLRETEDMVFALTWNRSLLYVNRKLQDNIQEAIYLALVDCWEHNNIVCVGGRCAKVINALALTDSDTSLVPRIRESYVNQIYAETLKILNDELLAASNDADADIRAAAEAFYDPDDLDNSDEDDPAHIKLRNRIKTRIDDNIDTYDVFDDAEKDSIRKTCYMAAVL